VVEPISLPREPRRSILVHMDDWCAQTPLSVRVVLVADRISLLMTLGLPCMISCMAYDGCRFIFSYRISCRVLGTTFLIPSFHRRTSISIPLALSVLIALGSLSWERWLTVMTVESAPVMRAQAAVASHHRLAE
jgi:hypothetical protein